MSENVRDTWEVEWGEPRRYSVSSPMSGDGDAAEAALLVERCAQGAVKAFAALTALPDGNNEGLQGAFDALTRAGEGALCALRTLHRHYTELVENHARGLSALCEFSGGQARDYDSGPTAYWSCADCGEGMHMASPCKAPDGAELCRACRDARCGITRKSCYY